MKVAVYTSFGVNYLAKARVLVDSLKAVSPDIDVIAIVCDRFPGGINQTRERFDQVWMVDEYPARAVKAWIFEHNIMELCTAVKGWGLERLLAAGYDYVFYLDPDCWVLQDPRQIIEVMRKDASVLVVPHTMSPAETSEGIRLVEISSLKHGIYNLGFLLVRNDENGRTFAKWWADRLHSHCFIQFEEGIFTDQRWFDLAVGYFPFIQIAWHKGIDVASWNIGQRSVTRSSDGGYVVDGYPLIFYHFSGVGPGGVHRWVRDIFAPSDPLIAELEFRYEELINQSGQRRLESVRPAYDFYDDGRLVEAADRRRFRNSEEANAHRFPDPFRTAQGACFRDTIHPPGLRSALPISKLSVDEVEPLALRLFDAAFYRGGLQLQETDDAALWAIYKERGWGDSNKPNRYFDHSFYGLSVPKDDKMGYCTPIHHFIAVGRQRGLAPVWFFDEAYYLKRYPDVLAAVEGGELSSGFEHFLRSGHLEGRRSSALFDEANYLRLYQDVAEAVSARQFANGGEHYLRCGCGEGRLGTMRDAVS